MEKTEKNDSYSHILKYTGIFGSVQGLSILIGLVRNKFAALLLGTTGMGLVSLFNSTINMVVSATNFGIPTSGVRDISEQYDASNEQLSSTILLIRSWCLFAALLGMFVCLFFSPLLDSITFVDRGHHVLHFILLAPAVAFLIVAGGEMAVLKATRQLRALAFSSLCVVFASLVISVPIYYMWRYQGIVGVLVLQSLAQMLLSLRYSSRHYPYRVSFSVKFLGRGIHVVKLGLAFVVAGLMSSGAEFLIRAYINRIGELSDVGLFNAGWTLAIVYAGLVFSAMEAVCVLLLIVMEIAGYRYKGLLGLGFGIVGAYLIETLFVLVYSRCLYRYVLSRKGVGFIAAQLLFVAGGLLGGFMWQPSVLYWAFCFVWVAVNVMVTLYLLKTQTRVFDRLLKRKEK